MKNPFKKMSREAKGALIVSSIGIVFFGSIAALSIKFSGKKTSDVGQIVSSIPVSISSSTSSTTISSSSPEESHVSKVVYLINKPVDDSCSYLHYYFDVTYEPDDERLSKALVNINGKIHQSRGVDFANSDDSEFMVSACYPGVVKSVTPNDRTYGNILTIESEDGLTFVYAGLRNITVKTGASIKQGDRLGSSSYTALSTNSNMVHLEIKYGEQYLNPERCFGKSFADLNLKSEDTNN